MSSEGQSLNNALASLQGCGCCGELRNELAALKAEVRTKLSQSDRAPIVEDSINAANARYGLALVPVALPSLAPLVPYVQQIIGALATILATIAGIAAIRGDIGSLQSEVSRIWGRINGSIEPTIQELTTTASIHAQRLNALQTGLTDTREIAIGARRRADAAYEFVEEVQRRMQKQIDAIDAKAEKAIAQANTAQFDAMLAKGAAREARLKAEAATDRANEAIDKANESYSLGVVAQNAAQLAQEDAKKALGEAGQARRDAQEAQLTATLANRAAERATNRADQAYGEATSATERANEANRKAQQALDSVNGLGGRIDQTQRGLDQLSSDSSSGNIFRRWSPNVWEPVVTAAETRITPAVQNIKVGFGEFDRALGRANSDIKKFQGDISTFDQSLKQAQSDIKAVQSRGTTISQEVKQAVTTQVNTTVGTLPADIKALPKAVSNLESRVGTLEGNDTSTRRRVGTLEGNDTSTRNRVGALENSDVSTRSRVGTLENSNANIRSRVGTLENANIERGRVDREGLQRLGRIEGLISNMPNILANDRTYQGAISTTVGDKICQEAQPGNCLGNPLGIIQDLIAGAVLGYLGSLVDGLLAGETPVDTSLAEVLERLQDIQNRIGTGTGGEPQEIDFTEVTQKIDRLAEVIGVDDYPASLPSSLVTKNGVEPQNVSIPSLTRLMGWQIERFDEFTGQWEIPIEIKDSDPSTPGDQPQSIKLPNLAEAVAEMFTAVIQSYTNTELLLNITTRVLIESGMDKQQNFVSYKLLQSLTDWVGFKQKDIKLDLPLSFTLNKTRYDEILKESTVQVQCVEFDEKFGLEGDLMRFREASGILQAVYKRKVDPRGDIKQQILDYLINTYRGVNKVNDSDQSMDEFISQVENGFTDIPTVGDPTQPYGRPFTQRPKIRNLTDLDTTP